MNHTHIPVIKSTELRHDINNVPTVVGVITAELLVKLASVPVLDPDKQTGYQRMAKPSRVKGLAADLVDKKVDLPTAILCNIRDPNAVKRLLKKTENEETFILNLDRDAPGNQDLTLYIVDGQHRMRAFEEAEKNGANLKNFKVPFVCMLGADEDKEIEQFYVVNSNAKPIGTDLTLELLKERAHRNPQFLNDLIIEGRKWQIDGQGIMRNLADRSEIWKNRIRMANQPKGDTTIPAASMVKSFKNLFVHTPVFTGLPDEQKVQLIDAYWRGIKNLLPNTFAAPKEHSIQKGIGVRVLHDILPTVLVHVKRDDLFRPKAYEDVLREVLTESLREANVDNEEVDGEAFWKSGREGAIGAYNGEAGIKRLTEKLKVLIQSHNPVLT